jgi:tetratricopeptide (TPR) repeat protein
MKIKKEVVTGLMVIMLVITLILIMINQQRNNNRRDFAAHIAELGNRNPTEEIESLQKSIAMYESRLENHVKDAAQTAVYWKILAVRFQDRDLHNEALKALERAIYYRPTDPVLHYLTGVSATVIAKNTLNFTGSAMQGRTAMFNLAEDAFLRAIDLDENYRRAHYSLGVLYSFDLDRPQDAIPHLLRALEISRSDLETMFVLARSYYMISFYREAIEVYDLIINTSRDPEKILEAQRNRQLVMVRLYG